MDNVIETLHEVTPLTNADLYSVLVMGLLVGVFVSDGFHALIEFIVKRGKKKDNNS